jgi:hypothetical protein
MILLKLQEFIRTFPHTEEGEIIARNREEKLLAATMKDLISRITEPVKRGDPEGLLELLIFDLRKIQSRKNRKEWDDFQREILEWRSR